MKKIILLLLIIFSLNISYWENTKTIDWMYLSDWYYIWKINWIDIEKNIISFDNYIRVYGQYSPITDLIESDYRKYIFSKWWIDSFFTDENRNFIEKNKNEKYVVFYANTYAEDFSESFKDREINIRYLNFIKCNENWKIYFDTNWYKVFPMWWTEEDEKYVKKIFWKLNSCEKLENFFLSNKRYYFSLEKQIDFRLYYFLIFILILIVILWIKYKLWKII